ncbi:MAG: hypothetical protein KJ015_09700 [Myxococcales bacterium]|nr:hypothetical protein [Myxococcales bacterium]
MAAKKKKRKNAVPKGACRSRSVAKAGVDIEQAPRDANALAALPSDQRLALAVTLGVDDELVGLSSLREHGVFLERALRERDARLAPEVVGADAAPESKGEGPLIDLVEISALTRDPDLQPRVASDPQVVAEYAEILDRLPAVTYFNDGDVFWLADGFLRVEAFEKAGRARVPAIMRIGTKRDALLFALGANNSHGARLTPADKRRAVALMLGVPEWVHRSDHWIAEHVGVSAPFVKKLRTELGAHATERMGRDGRVRGTPATESRPKDSGVLPGGAAPAADATQPPGHTSNRKRFQSTHVTGNPAVLAPAGGEDALSTGNGVIDSVPGTALPQSVKSLQARLDAVATGVQCLRAAFSEIIASTAGPSLLRAYAAEVEHKIDTLQKMLRAVTPDRQCPECRGEEKPCIVCQGGRWVATISWGEAAEANRP